MTKFHVVGIGGAGMSAIARILLVRGHQVSGSDTGPWPLAMPVGVAFFPKDAVRPVRRLADKILPTLTHWTEFDDGGHFAALANPELLVGDVRTFARSLRH